VKKLELISFIVSNDERFSVAIGDALRPFKWDVAPQPRLSMSLDVNSVIGWYSVLLHKEMKQWVDRCLEVRAHCAYFVSFYIVSRFPVCLVF
jgi:hypothetical protein